MKKIILTLVTIFIFKVSLAQNGEFKIQENGLIYSESTMNKLKSIADSLNLKFKVCDINKEFSSQYQVIGHKIDIKKNKVKEAKQDIKKNISFDEFQKKYPEAKITKNILIIRYYYKDYQDKNIVEFSEVSLHGGYGFELNFDKDLDKYEIENLSNWVFKHYKKTSYSEESISAFYLPSKIESKKLPKKYSQMISYSDCLIDTTTSKLKNNLKYGWVKLPKNWKNQSKIKQEKLLDKLRSISVIGGCSQDSRPREHAINIAMVSAETQKWEIFLKAHLDVMNDRFERVSDGSYAWDKRKTYIKELEELNINVLDLIIGISLRIENPSKNHYYGSIYRIGRALAETKNKDKVESQLFSIIEDNELDLYNRILGYYILDNYIYNQTKETKKNRLITKLKKSIKSLPENLHKQIKIE
ncbi:hypothetical protein [uncultured Tenacibaculum sp.]|uniref:hypothetical protein n=1 Tax=uncultured Tenacibaculum sp. TaxID=174713 RepID=UPI002631FB1B|nr:hypothetical protein [uncultured Tenacibaculum sp.]